MIALLGFAYEALVSLNGLLRHSGGTSDEATR